MPIDLRIITDSNEKTRVYKLRYKVFVEEEKRFSSSDKHISDYFDTLDETIHILAYHRGKPIASLRVTMDNPNGLPSDHYFDFQPLKERITGKCACIGWVCCRKEYRGFPGLLLTMLKICVREMIKYNNRHILSVLHPPFFRALVKMIGVKALADEFVTESIGVPIVPMHVDIENLEPFGHETIYNPRDFYLNDSMEIRLYAPDKPLKYGKEKPLEDAHPAPSDGLHINLPIPELINPDVGVNKSSAIQHGHTGGSHVSI